MVSPLSKYIDILGTTNDAGTRTGTACTTEAHLEATKALTAAQARDIAYAIAQGRVILMVYGSGDASSTVTLDSLQYSVNGTDYKTWVTFGTAITVGDGELAGPEITTAFPADATKIRFQTTFTDVDITLYAGLRLEV